LTAQGVDIAEVAEHLDSAHDHTLFISEAGRAHLDQEFGAVAADDSHFLISVRRALLDAFEEKTPVLAVIGEEDLAAFPAQCVFATPSRYALGGRVERGDSPIGIDGEDPVRDVFEDQLTVSWIEIIDNASTVA